MADATPSRRAATAQVTSALRRHRRPAAAGLGLCAVALGAALMIPVGLPDVATQDARTRLAGDTVTVAPEEDLSAFASTDRWGGLTYEELEALRRATETGADGDAARRHRMGFVGTTATPGDRVVLITLPGGEVRRFSTGGTLPDGRILSDVTDTTATLSGSSRGDEEMELFPRLPAEGETVAESPLETEAWQ